MPENLTFITEEQQAGLWKALVAGTPGASEILLPELLQWADNQVSIYFAILAASDGLLSITPNGSGSYNFALSSQGKTTLDTLSAELLTARK